ncbi:hypothetical protein SAMN05216403_101201 [Nitrosospira multiformis ATCC 25196]|uniref:Uncharacterized protein n=1 Tax=Nitrosospira multiformis (strain ATCC 25196 / NCIMB 11849 / C 71) TaxID=323848 RepID=A0A1H5RVR8_NITMU|nr:hypothetical protein SAMN05216411_101130 [Nitrosospira multiformis]SEF41717.1 hypothetical protein SAMN05216403_101201 [Nitrosospira multiformis ATCC 25196]
MTDQEAMNQSRAGLKTLLLKNMRIQSPYRAINVTILDSALHEGMKSLTFTILFIPFSIWT